MRQELNWREQALCKGMDQNFWVSSTRGRSLAVHRAICNACPVQEPCREYGLTHNSAGVYGGLTKSERKAERSRRGIKIEHPSPRSIYD